MYHPRRLQKSTPYICASCTRRLASAPARISRNYALIRPASFLGSVQSRRSSIPPQLSSSTISPNLPSSTIPHLTCNAYSTATTSRGRLRVAIIGSGPAGFYTAHRLMNKNPDVVIDMYEQLPVPYGLVRFGVAPDHPEVKNCQDTFEEVAQSPRFSYIGNVRVGYDIELSKMAPHYNAILFSYGASEDNKLDIPGEDVPGVYSARSFVGWYNGLPQFQALKPQLQAGEQAVVIGQGNVALDVARILLTPVDSLRNTDITEHALQTLSESKIRSVRVVGRRGPIQAAFTVKEARELMHIPPVAFEPIDRSLYPSDIKKLPRIQRRIAEVLLKGTEAAVGHSPKSWALDFLKAPKSMHADAGHLSSITFTKQEFPLAINQDLAYLPFNPMAIVRPTDQETTLEASVAFRSVGYKSTPLPGFSDIGVPFDKWKGIIQNDLEGRVVIGRTHPISQESVYRHVSGLYCAGWAKRGPTGVIASTMHDAFVSADVITQDWVAGKPFLNQMAGENGSTGLGWEALKKGVDSRGVRPLSWADWKTIDMAERARGKSKGKEREKFASVEQMLKVLDA
ncbi:NADPH:adrenodoxin oxidoreductase mitochondrial precursor [Clathrospora elynae]|uniref:NADPH:adrenodoxin oxidoreductase, mitochondrial n=1 Tax=Clathrospora elynae TaxID=706981 RepID=A0A6A5SI61_9PLEO|nr:NADPH:adrenodoxin oxidoreductase mitochondrial precursor [Clathrospora elynae]